MSTIGTMPLFGVPPEPARRLTVAQYHAMIRSGHFTDEDRIELLDGWIIPKMPRNPPHDFVVTRVDKRVLGPRLPPDWFTRAQSAVTLTDSEPEPDIAVVQGPDHRYVSRHPGPADIGLAVEVSDTTLLRDRGWKQQIYARERIAAYWIINLIDRQVEVYTDPSGPGADPCYRNRQDYRPGDSVPLVLNGVEITSIPASELLPEMIQSS